MVHLVQWLDGDFDVDVGHFAVHAFIDFLDGSYVAIYGFVYKGFCY